MEEELELDLNLIEVERARARQREAESQRQGDMTQYGEALKRVAARELPRRPAPLPSVLDRVTGATSIALGPLARALAGGMAAAGSPGQRPAAGTTPSQRYAEAEQALIGREDVFGRDFPVTATGLGLAGAVPRYGAASVIPGGPAMLGVAESLASRPQESLPGLAATVAGMAGRPELQGRLQRVAEDPLARTAADVMGGELIGLPFRFLRGRTPAATPRTGPFAQPPIPERLRLASASQGATPAQVDLTGPAIPMGPMGQRITDPTRLLGAGDVPIDLSSDPTRLLAAVAQSLEGTRSSPFEPGAVAGPALPGTPVPGGRRDFIAPIGPEIAASPDLTAAQQRLLQYAASPPSQTGFRNPETNRMAMVGGASATRRGPDVPMIPMSGGEPRRMVVPKQNVPGEVVRAMEERAGRSLQEMLEGRTNIEGMRPDVAASPLFLANVPVRTVFDEAAAPLTPLPRQTPETRQMFPTATGPENLTPELRPSPIRTALEAAGPAPVVTRLDPGAFPYLVNRRAGGRGAVLPRTRQIPGGPVQRMLSGSSETGPFADVPRPGVSLGAEGAAEGTVRGSRRAAMAEAGEFPTPEMEALADAPDFMGDIAENLRNREGFTTAQMLEALARAGVGGLGGSVIGGAMGETPEERRAFALSGLGIGMGLGGASGFIGRQSAQNRRINEALDEVERVMRRRQGASPTATPFTATGAPPGIERATIAGAPGVGAASPTPRPRTEGEPIVRPTTVRPKDEPRLQRLNLSSEMQDIYGPRIRALSAEIETTGKQTWADLKDEAARLLNVKRETLADINPNRMTGAEGLAIASLVRENTEALARLAGEYDTAVKTGVTADVDRIAGLMNDLEAQTGELLKVFMKGTSAQGRALQAQRVLANLTSDPTYWFVKGQRVKGAEVLTAAERTRITDLLNAGPEKRDDLMRYLASLRRTGLVGQVAQLRRGSLLSGVTGRLYDFVGTGLNMLEGGTRPLQAALDRAASYAASKKVGGTTAQYRSLLAPTWDEIKRTVRGAWDGGRNAIESLGVGSFAPRNIREKGLRASAKEWSEFIRQIELDPQAAARLDVPRMVNITMFGESRPGKVLNTLADTYHKFFMRFSGVTDKVFRAGAYAGSMQEQARLAATREGLRGPAFEARVQDLLQNPTDVMRANAIMESDMLTFTNDGALARGVGAAIEGFAQAFDKARLPGFDPKLGELVRGLANINIPFRRTPSNVTTRILEHTPGIGWAMTAKRAQNWWGNVAQLAAATKPELAAKGVEVQRSQRKFIQSLTRNASGLGMVALGRWLWENDLLTGDQPSNETEAEQWRTEGRLPNAMWFPFNGGEWVPISRLAPLGTVLAVGANYAQEQAQEPSTGMLETAGGFTGSALRTSLDQPMLTGPSEMIEALTGKDDWKRESFLENLAGSFVPTAIAAGARASGEQRVPTGMGEAIAMRIPGLEESVPVRRDIFGQPTQRATGYFLPTGRDIRASDPLVAEMARVGAQVGPVDRKKGEDPQLYAWRAENAGREVRAAMEETMASPDYLAATPKEQKEMLEKAASRARTEFSKWAKETYNIEP